MEECYKSNEKKFKTLEKERPDEMEMAKEENEKREEKENEEIINLSKNS